MDKAVREFFRMERKRLGLNQTQLADLPFYPEHMELGDILQRLAAIAPNDVEAIKVIADDTLRRRWAQMLDRIRPH